MPKKFNLKRLIPIAIIALGLTAFYYFDLFHYLSFEALRDYRHTLVAWNQNHPFTSAIIYISIYILAVTFSFPGATIITLAGGFLFGIILGSLYVLTGATIGACFIFLATRYAFADLLAQRAGMWIKKLEKGFQENAFNYLLFLRLIPLFPFWLINIVPALLNMKFRDYFVATLLGIIPGTIVYVAVGNGLSSVFNRGETPNFGIIFEPQILIPLIGLAALSALPIVYKKWKRK